VDETGVIDTAKPVISTKDPLVVENVSVFVTLTTCITLPLGALASGITPLSLFAAKAKRLASGNCPELFGLSLARSLAFPIIKFLNIKKKKPRSYPWLYL
jgi:hypothetical protein